MKESVTQLAQEIIDQAAEVGLAAERLPSGTIAVSTTLHLHEAREALQRALESLRYKVDDRRSPRGSV